MKACPSSALILPNLKGLIPSLLFFAGDYNLKDLI